MTYEGIRLRILKIIRTKLANSKRKQLTNKDFTIISNNCWAGMIYESYNLQKNTPTIGLYFFASDYIKFLKNLKENVNKKIEFISPQESKWYEYIKNDKKIGQYPIGKIDDIEIFFLHYKNEKEVIDKWSRRVKRINWDNLLVKFNDQNLCKEKDMKEFLELPFENKLFFTVKDWDTDGYLKFKQPFEKKFIKASYEPFYKNSKINITTYLNNLKKEQKNEKRK